MGVCVFVKKKKKKNLEEEICDHSIPVKKMCIPREERSRATHISWRRFVGWNTHHIKTKQKQTTNKNKKVSKRDRFQLLQLVECCFTSTETVGLLGTGTQDGHLDFHTAPEL